MVIACSQCQTRFHVADERIPADGIKVRCSRCKHSFFVRAPGASPDEAVHAVAERAAESPAPEPSLDLAGNTAPPEEEEEDWQFAIDPPSAAASRAPEPEPAEAEKPAPKAATDPGIANGLGLGERKRGSSPLPEPETSSLADLSNPESWDLLGGDAGARADDAGEPIPEVTAEPETEAGLDDAEDWPADPSRPAPAGPVAIEEEEGWEETPYLDEPDDVRRSMRPPRRSALPALGVAFQAAGWLALVTLLALVVRGASLGDRSASRIAPPVALAGLEARNVQGRVVENAAAGPLLVVTGSLANPTPTPLAPERAVRVVLLDDDSRSLPASALAGLPLDPVRLRVEDPDALRAELEVSAAHLARRRVGAGEVVPFQALFAAADPRASAFRLEEAPAPALPAPPVAVPAEEVLDAAAEAGGRAPSDSAGSGAGPGEASGTRG